MMNPHGLYCEIISSDLNPVLRVKGAVIAGLDSTAPHTAISNGRILQSQLDDCAKVFRRACPLADAIRIGPSSLCTGPGLSPRQHDAKGQASDAYALKISRWR